MHSLAHKSLDNNVIFFCFDIFEPCNRHNNTIIGIIKSCYLCAIKSFRQNSDISVGKVENLMHLRYRSDFCQVFGLRFTLFHIILKAHKYKLIVIHCVFDSSHGLLSSDVKMQNHSRENTESLQRKQRECISYFSHTYYSILL